MPRHVLVYKCLIVSPSDVDSERDHVKEIISAWNAQVGDAFAIRVDPVAWESHSVPDLSNPPQDVLNEQIVDDSDFAIGIFHSRLGTPTRKHDSGSVEEIERLLKRGARVLLYFSNAPVDQERLDPDEYKRLQEAKKRFRERGLVSTFESHANLREQVQLHLTNVVIQLAMRDRPEIANIDARPTKEVAKPDVRILSRVGLVPHPVSDEIKTIVAIEVQNHDTSSVFLGNIFLRMKDDRIAIPLRDAVTGQYQARRELRPGEAYSFRLSIPQLLADNVPIDDIVTAGLKDDIDRVYEADAQEFRKNIEAARGSEK